MHKILKAIKKGNLEQLKQYLEEDPAALRKSFDDGWYGYPDVGLLHHAAYFDQPEIVKFLVREKGLDIDKVYDSFTPLHYAAKKDAYKAVDALLSLGANARLTNSDSKAPYEICTNSGIADVLLEAYNAGERKEEPVEQKKEISRPAQGEAAATGAWKPGVTDEEIIFQRDMLELSLRLMETFNFAADIRILVAQNLETGDVSQPETKLFSEIPKMVEQARAERAKLRGPKLVCG